MALGLSAMGPRPAAAQTDRSPDRWQVTFDDGQYAWNVQLVSLTGDTLLVRQSDSLVRAPLTRIHEIRLFHKTELRVGDEHESAVAALMGGQDEIYDLAQLDVAGRRDAIRRILAQHAPEDPE